MKEINWNHYRIFLEVYNTKSLPKAAKNLDMTRTGVGKSIKSLNTQIGVDLFKFHPKGVEITADAEALYKEIGPTLQRLANIEKNLLAFDRKGKDIITIGSAQTSMTTLLKGYIASFKEVCPNITIEIIDLEGDNVAEALKSTEIDLAVGYMPFDKGPELEKIVLGNTQTVFVAEKQFAKKHDINDIITQEEFNRLPLVGVRGYLPWREPTVIVDRMESVFQLVMDGIGVGWFIHSFVDNNHPHDPYVKFQVDELPPQEFELYCLYLPQSIKKAASLFIDHIKSSQT